MKVTKAQAQANRAHIVETASTLFRERGYDGVGVADLMGAAGFTHGGFYKHFGSKADLMAEAAACGFATSAEALAGTDLRAFLTYYLSREHRDAPGKAARWRHCARMPRVSRRRSRLRLQLVSTRSWKTAQVAMARLMRPPPSAAVRGGSR